MNLGSRKFWTWAIPVIVAVVLLAVLGGLSSFRSKSASTTANSAAVSVTPAPQDATHERAALSEELKKNPGHPPILLRLAELERNAGKNADAAKYLQQALAKDPGNADARLELGRALFEAGDIDGAIKETERLVKDHPTNVDGLYNLGAIYANLDKLDLARTQWKRAVEVDANSDSGRKAKDGLAKIGP